MASFFLAWMSRSLIDFTINIVYHKGGMRILITGSSGNIGSKIAEIVTQRGICIGVDLVPGKFTTHLGSITDQKLMKEIIPGVDAIIHSAAYLTPHLGVKSEHEFRYVNVHGTEVLLNLAIRHNIKRFVFTSTTSVYGCTTRPKTEAIWVTEALSPNPEDIYDLTKLEAEQLCQQASRTGMNSIILRMSRCFPEPDHLLVFYRLYRGVSRRDVAEAHWLAATSSIPGSETFIISADSPFQQTETRMLFIDPWKVIDGLYAQASKLFDQMKWEKPASVDRVYVIEKAKRLLNYQPQDNFITFLQRKAGLIT
jgi:UDP-glucose 4-epimerase